MGEDRVQSAVHTKARKCDFCCYHKDIFFNPKVLHKLLATDANALIEDSLLRVSFDRHDGKQRDPSIWRRVGNRETAIS